MIVEDEVELAQLYSFVLSRNGYPIIHVAHDGLGAIQAVQSDKKNIDLVIMDQKMHNIDGIKASIEIKKLKPEVRIIMASAYDVPKENENLFDAVLSKPFGNQLLLRTVELVAAKVIRGQAN
jgi:CheY-like chemotaxis protein